MANPPVCRIMDYGKYKFDEAQKAKESQAQDDQRRDQGDEVPAEDRPRRLRHQDPPGRSSSSNEGHKVKVTIMFRGREVFHPELGKRILDRVAEQVDGTAKVEVGPEARRSQHDHGAGTRQAGQAVGRSPGRAAGRRRSARPGAAAGADGGEPSQERRAREWSAANGGCVRRGTSGGHGGSQSPVAEEGDVTCRR